MLGEWKEMLSAYINEIKLQLGAAYCNALVYGSLARDEYKTESDIDIAIFTDVLPQDFYKLAEEISETTFEYNVKYDVILSPVFINRNNYQRMFGVMPFYQSIEREGIVVG